MSEELSLTLVVWAGGIKKQLEIDYAAGETLLNLLKDLAENFDINSENLAVTLEGDGKGYTVPVR